MIVMQAKKPWSDEETSYQNHLIKGKDGKLRISPERQKLHQQIIEKALEGVETAAPGEQEVLFMGGGGGSGKSYLISSQYIDVPPKEAKKAVFIDPDVIKDSLPEYVAMKNSPHEEVRKMAAQYVQQESSLIAEQIYRTAVANGKNAVYDGTASNMKALKAQTDYAKQAGVTTKAVYVATPIDVARQSAQTRYLKEDRFVADEILTTAHRSVSANFEKIATSDMFSSVQLVANNRKDPLSTIAEAKNGKLTINDQQKYQEFIDKKNL